MSRDVTPLPRLSHLVSSRGARNDTSKIKNNKTQHSLKTQQTTIKLKQPSLQNARHPIHRVRIPYSKFSSPKTCRNVHENSLKIGHMRFSSNAPMTPEGLWYACVRGRLEIVWRHKHAKEENTRSLFSCFLRWNFLKVCMLHDIDAYFTI